MEEIYKSPCLKCRKRGEDKKKCSVGCKKLKKYQKSIKLFGVDALIISGLFGERSQQNTKKEDQ